MEKLEVNGPNFLPYDSVKRYKREEGAGKKLPSVRQSPAVNINILSFSIV